MFYSSPGTRYVLPDHSSNIFLVRVRPAGARPQNTPLTSWLQYTLHPTGYETSAFPLARVPPFPGLESGHLGLLRVLPAIPPVTMGQALHFCFFILKLRGWATIFPGVSSTPNSCQIRGACWVPRSSLQPSKGVTRSLTWAVQHQHSFSDVPERVCSLSPSLHLFSFSSWLLTPGWEARERSLGLKLGTAAFKKPWMMPFGFDRISFLLARGARNFHLLLCLYLPRQSRQIVATWYRERTTWAGNWLLSCACAMNRSKRVMEETINLSQKRAEQVTDYIKYKLQINCPSWKYHSFSEYYKVPKENLEINESYCIFLQIRTFKTKNKLTHPRSQYYLVLFGEAVK